ncbi:hypothetical protein GWI33_002096 [Rhynchophorus ferrugineus]|uniref:Uncharacterized protein n=1 Tax=Rhynchophorus ferrugineus TaxID=354439 RepID=A0A834MLP8_RHYFE|nr:hypothetical protein GWI33_002096 [Rhynchophorus ferrugineus]
MKYCAVLAVLLVWTASVLADVSTLQDSQNLNQDTINPLNDPDQDLTNNDQDKRTICGALNGLRCGGASKFPKQFLFKSRPGYAYVRPVIGRPGGYKYTKPKIPLTITAPSSSKPAVIGGWKPAVSPTKPGAVAVLKPTTSVDVIHSNPVPHVDHVQAAGFPGHVHLQGGAVHFQPVAVQGPHIDQIHQVQIPHGGHYDTLSHVDHVHQVPTAPLVPVQPVPTPVAVPKPFVPSAILFEVTKPNLGVLPLGARFQTPILREAPHIHFKPAPLPIAPTPVAVPLSPAPAPLLPAPTPVLPQPAIQGILQTPVGLPAIAPQPGVSVEYHGTRNYLPLGAGYPVAPHIHQHAYPVPTPAFPLPSAAALPVPEGPALTVPHFHQAPAFAPQQQLPHEHQAHFLQQQQQQAAFEASPNFLFHQQQAQQAQQIQYPDIPQQQLPLEGEQEYSTINLPNLEQNNVIQPGLSDLQIPYHYPQHQGWQRGDLEQGDFSEEDQQQQQPFRPSAELEAPYVNK